MGQNRSPMFLGGSKLPYGVPCGGIKSLYTHFIRCDEPFGDLQTIFLIYPRDSATPQNNKQFALTSVLIIFGICLLC